MKPKQLIDFVKTYAHMHKPNQIHLVLEHVIAQLCNGGQFILVTKPMLHLDQIHLACHLSQFHPISKNGNFEAEIFITSLMDAPLKIPSESH